MFSDQYPDLVELVQRVSALVVSLDPNKFYTSTLENLDKFSIPKAEEIAEYKRLLEFRRSLQTLENKLLDTEICCEEILITISQIRETTAKYLQEKSENDRQPEQSDSTEDGPIEDGQPISGETSEAGSPVGERASDGGAAGLRTEPDQKPSSE